jgi:hypothetical protein
MTAAGAADSEIFEIMQYVEQQLRSNDNMRRELATAVRGKDESAVRKVASTLWKGLKKVAPIAFSVFLWLLGAPQS